MKKRLVIPIHLATVLWLAVCLFYAGTAGAAAHQKEGKDCCAFSLNFVNLYKEKPVVKKIRVSATCDTRICCADPDLWYQTGDIPNYVEWFPADSTPVPYGNAIDNDFMIYIDGSTDPFTLQVEFIDLQDQVICRQILTLSCTKVYKEDEDWTKFTTRTALDDKNLFVFAVRDEEEDGEEDDSDYCSGSLKDQVSCEFDHSISCLGTDTYHVSLDGPGGFDTYNWTVVSGPATPAIAPGENSSVDLTTAGVYLVSLVAVNTVEGDTCVTVKDVLIPFFSPQVSHTRLPCGYQVQFTGSGAGDPGAIAEYQWSCAGFPNFPASGNPVVFDFGSVGTYTLSMTILDTFGCAHSMVYTCTISDACDAEFEVDHYTLCPDCVGPANIEVFFNNLSQGGLCPITYNWDFGDGTTLTTDAYGAEVSHVYAVPDCRTKAVFTVTLQMIDSSEPTPCVTTVTHLVVIEPCSANLSVIVCPDGKVVMTADKCGTWNLPTNAEEAPWVFNDDWLYGSCGKRMVARFPNGAHSVSFTSHCITGGECTQWYTFNVTQTMCAKNEKNRGENYHFIAGGKEFKIKHKIVQRQFSDFHRIKVKTKLKKYKVLVGIGFWQASKADSIISAHNGTIYGADPVCNCSVSKPTENSKPLSNKTKSKYNYDHWGWYRSRLNSLESYHKVVRDGVTVELNLNLGLEAVEFHWWTQWF